jgi:hypothetical protein
VNTWSIGIENTDADIDIDHNECDTSFRVALFEAANYVS